eukprot:663222-Pyramimonas_sp.AAC.1
MGTRADEDTFMNMPTTSAPRPHTYDEYPTAWIFEKNPITEEEARGYMNVFTSLSRNDWCWSRGAARVCMVRRCLKRQGYSENAMNWLWQQTVGP